MSDHELINFLIAQTGSPFLAARALGSISTQRLFNWRHRGIPFRYRALFRVVANRHGAKLPLEWLDASVPSVLEEEQSGRDTDGRASPQQRAEKAQAKDGKRKGPQQPRRPARRRAARRGEAAVAG
jgi:hypothetical protein